jgi:hypothetical protein
MKTMLTSKEVAAIEGVCYNTIRKRAKSSLLHCVKSGKRDVFPADHNGKPTKRQPPNLRIVPKTEILEKPGSWTYNGDAGELRLYGPPMEVLGMTAYWGAFTAWGDVGWISPQEMVDARREWLAKEEKKRKASDANRRKRKLGFIERAIVEKNIAANPDRPFWEFVP